MEKMEEKKKPIMPILKKMKVGDVEVYPAERYDTVRITVANFNLMNKRKGVFLTNKRKGLEIIVTRVS